MHTWQNMENIYIFDNVRSISKILLYHVQDILPRQSSLQVDDIKESDV